jgi:hypothetical protein
MRRSGLILLTLVAACTGNDPCPANGAIDHARAIDPTHIELVLSCPLGVDSSMITVDSFTRAPGTALSVVSVDGSGSKDLTITTDDAQAALVTYTVRLDGANGPDGQTVAASANFVGVGALDTASVTISVDDRYDQRLTGVSAMVTVDPQTGVFTDYTTTIPLADPDGDHVWTATLRVAVDPLRTVSTADDRLGPGRVAYAARAVAADGTPLSKLVTFEVKTDADATVALPLSSVPAPPGPEGLVTVHVHVDDTPARALVNPMLRVSATSDGTFDPSFPTTIALADPNGDHVWDATASVRIAPDRRIGGTTSETLPYVFFVQSSGIDYPNVNAQVEALTEAPVDASIRVGNPALVPVTFRVDVSAALLSKDGTIRGLFPGEAPFLTGEFGTAEDAFGQNAADHFGGGENVVLQMQPRTDHAGVWERTLFLGPSRTYGWKVVRCPADKGCADLNRHVTSSGRAFATVMKNLATENRDAQTATAVKIIDPRRPVVTLDGGGTLDYTHATVYAGNGTGLEPNPSGVPDGVRMFKQEMPDLFVNVGTEPVATPVMVVGTWRDVNLPETLAQIISNNMIFDLNPWDYDSGFVGAAPPQYILQAPPPFHVGDGMLDANAKLVPGGSASTMTLHLAVSGTTLYVACETTGAGSDHFLFVSNTAPSAAAAGPAPWAKAGTVAFVRAQTVFLAGENDSAFVGWFGLGDGMAISRPDAVSAKNGVMEGMIDLAAQFGTMPDTIYVAVAPYASPDGGQMYAASQMPATTNSDGNIDATEIATVKVSDYLVGP